ncbi:DUF3325 family protein [Halopseudomonas bauzanensis]|uniref:DUF3325 family protein n=1 Tax=Halopseudomonas bauzanensis TaxID=653930 RepID=UPI000944BA07
MFALDAHCFPPSRHKPNLPTRVPQHFEQIFRHKPQPLRQRALRWLGRLLLASALAIAAAGHILQPTCQPHSIIPISFPKQSRKHLK